jgi:predicted RNA-binding Zn ribbon-like protein
MIRVTWEWLGRGPALDLADTVTVSEGSEHDLIAAPDEYRRWADAEAAIVHGGSSSLFERARPRLMQLRDAIRRALGAMAAGEPPPRRAINELNRASRAAPQWLELDRDARTVRQETSGHAVERLVAIYARSAVELVAREGSGVRRCPAPSCGMFFLSGHPRQRWCSVQCGTRARVARHYRRRRDGLAGSEVHGRF